MPPYMAGLRGGITHKTSMWAQALVNGQEKKYWVFSNTADQSERRILRRIKNVYTSISKTDNKKMDF